MKHFYFIVLIALFPAAGMAQIGVGTTSLDASAMLQVNASASTNAKGFLGPRVELTSTSANTPFSVTPATGLMVYNTATAGSGSTAVTPGYYSYNGTTWDRLATQPVMFVDGTAGNLRGTRIDYGFSYGMPSPTNVGNIVLPPGRWEIRADYTVVVREWGYHSTLIWSDVNGIFYTFFLVDDTQAAPGNLGHSMPINPTTTSHSIVANGAKATVAGTAGGKEIKFYINNNTGADRTYTLYFNESYAGLPATNDGTDGYLNSYYPSNSNRLFATKIQ